MPETPVLAVIERCGLKKNAKNAQLGPELRMIMLSATQISVIPKLKLSKQMELVETAQKALNQTLIWLTVTKSTSFAKAILQEVDPSARSVLRTLDLKVIIVTVVLTIVT